jgi:hypothetical protein
VRRIAGSAAAVLLCAAFAIANPSVAAARGAVPGAVAASLSMAAASAVSTAFTTAGSIPIPCSAAIIPVTFMGAAIRTILIPLTKTMSLTAISCGSGGPRSGRSFGEASGPASEREDVAAGRVGGEDQFWRVWHLYNRKPPGLRYLSDVSSQGLETRPRFGGAICFSDARGCSLRGRRTVSFLVRFAGGANKCWTTRPLPEEVM